MCFNRESDGREKWRFGLDDKNIYTVVRDCNRKIKRICRIYIKKEKNLK